jgi:outer membrane receptor protein involved in Fe transport
VKDLVRDAVPPPEVPPDTLIETSPVVYAEASREGETAIKYDLTLHVPGVDTIQAGGSVRTFGLDYEVRSPYGNDTPFAPEPGLDPLDFAERFRAYQSSAYAQLTTNLTPRLGLTAGGRFDQYQYLGQHRFSPRGGLSFALSDRLSWRASAGVYYQPPPFLFASSFPDNRRLQPWRSNHLVTGFSWSPRPGLHVNAEVYRKTYREYPVAAELPSVSLANIGDTFDVRSILFRLVSEGTGHAEGLELFVEKRLTGRVYGQANLAFSRTRHAGLDGVLRPGSFDYPQVFNLTGGYQLTPRWDVDLRADRRLTVRGQDLNVFFGVQNVTNRRNLAGYSWNRRTNALQVNEQQGVFPILGFDWRF